jgi:serine/threonine protein kinase
MAPELLSAIDFIEPTLPVDIFAFGIMSYVAFSGETSFPGPDIHTFGAAVISGERPKKPKERDDLSDNLWGLLERCWHGKADARPSIRIVLEELEVMSCKRLGVSDLYLQRFESNSELSLAILRSAMEAPGYGAALGLSETTLLDIAETVRALSSQVHSNLTPDDLHRRQSVRNLSIPIYVRAVCRRWANSTRRKGCFRPPLLAFLFRYLQLTWTDMRPGDQLLAQGWSSLLTVGVSLVLTTPISRYGSTNSAYIFSKFVRRETCQIQIHCSFLKWQYRVHVWRKLWLNLVKALRVAGFTIENMDKAIVQMEENLVLLMQHVPLFTVNTAV